MPHVLCSGNAKADRQSHSALPIGIVETLEKFFSYFKYFHVTVIPLALLVQPHFRSELPHCLSYATVGQLLAHELLHAFDLTNSEWLTPAARLGLVARVDCLARQSPGMQQTQYAWNENMADIGALHTAYQAWKGQPQPVGRLSGLALAPAQLFHVAAAQTFCSVPDVENVHRQPHR